MEQMDEAARKATLELSCFLPSFAAKGSKQKIFIYVLRVKSTVFMF